MISRRIFLTVFSLIFLVQKAYAIGVDEAVEKYFSPFSDKFSQLIFVPVKILGAEVPILIFLMMAASIFCTFYFRCIGIWGFKHSLFQIFHKKDTEGHKGEVSTFGALATALSGTVGIGNIAGVAIAISLGGPGAMFWMCMGALFGMALKFCEVTLSLKHRKYNPDGTISGGPMFYIEQGFSQIGHHKTGKISAYIFAIACLLGTIGGGCMLQTNQAAQQFIVITGGSNSFFNTHCWIFGLCVAIVIGLVIVGGIKSIARVTSKVVPFMCVLYALACLTVIITHFTQIPQAFYTIIHEAFFPKAVAGGIIGSIIIGLRRSLQSNEAGLGSSPIAYAAVKTNEPVSQGFVSMIEPFLDTVIVCSMTAFVIILTGQYLNYTDGISGVELTSAAFQSVIPFFPYVLAVIIILFALSTILSWAYYGQKAWTFLTGENKKCIIFYQILFCIFIVIGSSMSIQSVIDFTDATYLVMAAPNLLAIFIMLKDIKKELIEYCKRHNLIFKMNKVWFKDEQ
ncbi:MAG: alanine:cation symporter family protein [Candidatus Gastranaerophilales bacterium]|nr:alanine:cation symporter family protein [Candidatus Gastranaerophilales bacterium]